MCYGLVGYVLELYILPQWCCQRAGLGGCSSPPPLAGALPLSTTLYFSSTTIIVHFVRQSTCKALHARE